jgi:hypothetical protein
MNGEQTACLVDSFKYSTLYSLARKQTVHIGTYKLGLLNLSSGSNIGAPGFSVTSPVAFQFLNLILRDREVEQTP